MLIASQAGLVVIDTDINNQKTTRLNKSTFCILQNLKMINNYLLEHWFKIFLTFIDSQNA